MHNAKPFLSTAFLAFAVLTAHAGEPFQSQDRFAAAIRDFSTSPYYVLITVVDDRTGRSKTGCTTVNFLMGAILRENDLGFSSDSMRRGQEIALGNTTHVFHFSKQDALNNLAMNDTPEHKKNGEKACEFIVGGQSARMADLTGQVIAVP